MTAGLALRKLSVRAAGRELLRDVSVDLKPGACVAVVGPNGAGKSTLLKASLGLCRDTSGEVLWQGRAVAGMGGRERAAALAWLPQRSTIREILAVRDFVMAARFRFDESRSSAAAAASNALQEAGAKALENRILTTLSGGEFQRVMMAALIAQDASAFLLDEPANHLDPARQVAFYQMIRSQWQAGRAVLCVTHDINLISHLAAKSSERPVVVLGLKQGRVLFQAELHEPQLHQALEELFSMRLALREVDGRSYYLPGSEAL